MNSICHPPGADWSCYGTEQDVASLDPTMKERAEALAWSTLASLTAYQVGTCPVTVRPCRAGCPGAGTYMESVVRGGSMESFGVRVGSFAPHINPLGVWVNGCGCRSEDCSCTQLCEVILPGPVGAITEVWVDDELLDPTAYRVDNGDHLVRTDGGCWPDCQDMAKPFGQPGTFAVTYYRGAPPNTLTLWATGTLAVEFYKACSGEECRLPSNVTSVTRQGVSYQIESASFPNGTTGIDEVDAVIRIYNPGGLRRAPIFTGPGVRRARQTTWMSG